MSIELGRRLIAAGAVHPSEIEAAFYRQLVAPMPFVRALLELGHVTEEVLEQELANRMVPFLATIVPLPAIVEELPNQMCRRLMAVPVRRDPRTGLVDVAAVDPFDSNIPYEFSYHLKSEVRILRGALAAIEQALVRIDRGEYTASVILRKSVRPPGYATPSVPPLRSDRPIPLVRKSRRRHQVEVHPVRSVAGPATEQLRREPASAEVPPAPSVPTFEGRPSPYPRSRQRTAPGPPGVPEPRETPPATPSYRGRPEVPVAVPSARPRPEVPSGAPASAKPRPEVATASPTSARGRSEEPTATPSASPQGAKRRPEVPSGPPAGARGRPEAPSVQPSVKPRPEVPGAATGKPRPPPPPAVVPMPASARGGAKVRVEASGAAPSASAASPKKAPPAAAGSATRERSASAPQPARAAQGTKARTSSSPPTTTRGPFSPKAPTAPFADIRGVLAAMETATTRDDVIDCLIVGTSTVARRVGVFAVKKGHFRGVACNAELGDAARFRTIEISAEATTVLGIAATSGSYLGPLPVTKPHQDLLAFMKDASSEVSATLIRVAGRPAVILFADGLGDSMIATRRAEELGHEASLALSRIVTEAKASRGRT